MPDKNDLVDLLRVDGVLVKGYGTIPKAVMMDKRLTVCAKAIYAYFCSYCGAGAQAFPSFHKIINDLQISKNYYYRNLNLLKKYDYVRVKQQRFGGQYKRNIYTLTPFPSTSETVIAPFPLTGEPVSREHNNNKSNINRNNILSYQSKVKSKRKKAQIDMMDRIEYFTDLVKTNIEYDALITPPTEKLVDSIVAVIVDTLISDAKTFRINGTDMDAEAVQNRLLTLDNSDISCVLNSVDLASGHLRNPKNYLLTTLYNAPATSELFWKTEINQLMRDYHNSGRKHRVYDPIDDTDADAPDED